MSQRSIIVLDSEGVPILDGTFSRRSHRAVLYRELKGHAKQLVVFKIETDVAVCLERVRARRSSTAGVSDVQRFHAILAAWEPWNVRTGSIPAFEFVVDCNGERPRLIQSDGGVDPALGSSIMSLF